MAQDMLQHLMNRGAQHLVDDALSERVQHACRKAEELAMKKGEMEVDWVEEIFFKPNRQGNKVANDHVAEEGPPEHGREDVSLGGDEVESASLHNSATQELQNASSRSMEAMRRQDVEQIQKAQREQLEAEISHMATQLKASTQRMNSTIRGQTEHLDEMETLATENVNRVGKAADSVEEHNKKAWSSTIATWTLMLTIFGTFLFCMITIRMAPKRADTSLPCLVNCHSNEKTLQERAMKRLEELRIRHQEVEREAKRTNEEVARREAEEMRTREVEAKRISVEEATRPAIDETVPLDEESIHSKAEPPGKDVELHVDVQDTRIPIEVKENTQVAEGNECAGNDAARGEAADDEHREGREGSCDSIPENEATEADSELASHADFEETSHRTTEDVPRVREAEATLDEEAKRLAELTEDARWEEIESLTEEEEAAVLAGEKEALRNTKEVHVAEEARILQDEAKRRADEEEAARILEQEVKRQAEVEEAIRRAEAQAARILEQEAMVRAEEEEAIRAAEEEAAKRLAEEEAMHRAENDKAIRLAEEEAARILEKEANYLAEEEKAARLAEDEALARGEESFNVKDEKVPEQNFVEEDDDDDFDNLELAKERLRKQAEAARKLVEEKLRKQMDAAGKAVPEHIENDAPKRYNPAQSGGPTDCRIDETCLNTSIEKATADTPDERCQRGECSTSIDIGETLDFTENDVHTAAATNDIESLRRFLRIKPEFAIHKDDNGWEPLHEAAYGRQVEAVEMLLQQPLVDVNTRTARNGATALWWLRGIPDDDPVVVLLKAAGGYVDGPEL